MDKIICLVGESGSGKSTIAESLEKEGYNYIQSYTDRPKRHESERGHIFVKGGFQEWLFETPYINIIAETHFDGHHYWATKEQYQGKGTSIYIIDPVGVKDLKEKIKDAEILIIHLKTDSDKRYARMWDRAVEINISNTSKKKTTLSDIKKRAKHDNEAFRIVECNYAVDANRPIEEVLKDIKSLI